MGAVFLLIAYAFLALLYQYTLIWILGPVVLVASYVCLIIIAKGGLDRLPTTLLIISAPLLLALGMLARMGGIRDASDAGYVLAYLFAGVVALWCNYLALKWLRRS